MCYACAYIHVFIEINIIRNVVFPPKTKKFSTHLRKKILFICVRYNVRGDTHECTHMLYI